MLKSNYAKYSNGQIVGMFGSHAPVKIRRIIYTGGGQVFYDVELYGGKLIYRVSECSIKTLENHKK
jgi:hypothetical protein